MTVFRIEKTKDFTVMSNHHLRNKTLSLKAKGLLSLMLSLPEDWDYTTKGLAQICKEGVDSISTALKELEKHGYLTRHRIRYKNGQLGDVEYTIHERPLDHNERGISPDQENPEQVKPIQDTLAQLNTNIQNTKKQNTNLSINLSALGTDYKAGGIKSNLTEGSRILYRHDGRDFKEEDGKRTDSITAASMTSIRKRLIWDLLLIRRKALRRTDMYAT